MFNNMLVNLDANEVELVWLVYELRLSIMIKKKSPPPLYPAKLYFIYLGLALWRKVRVKSLVSISYEFGNLNLDTERLMSTLIGLSCVFKFEPVPFTVIDPVGI